MADNCHSAESYETEEFCFHKCQYNKFLAKKAIWYITVHWSSLFQIVATTLKSTILLRKQAENFPYEQCMFRDITFLLKIFPERDGKQKKSEVSAISLKRTRWKIPFLQPGREP